MQLLPPAVRVDVQRLRVGTQAADDPSARRNPSMPGLPLPPDELLKAPVKTNFLTTTANPRPSGQSSSMN
jgi:hypothetical protein